MSSDKDIFIAALDLPDAAERAAFLDRGCCGDSAKRKRIEELLSHYFDGGDFMEGFTRPSERAPDSNETPGGIIDQYTLLEKLGEGGFGAVYVAEQREPFKRRVAIKIIKLGMDTRQIVARFEAERQALAMMDHPNIAKVLDAGATETGRPYFVMELVRGIRITDYCDQARLSTRERLELFIKVCHAIQHAHQKGVIHRDVKPSNILVTLHDGVPIPKVIDFGIAKATERRLTEATVYTQLHQFIGTPAYMSPEQAEMSGLDIDTRSDIYSLGVLLYELLTGSTPFDAGELMSRGVDTMRKTIREKEPMRPSTRLATLRGDQLTTTAKRRSMDTAKLLHQLKGDLDWIVMKSLEKDRTRRYDTANGLAMDIRRYLSNEPVAARPPSKVYEFQKFVRRHKAGFTATAAVFVALVLGVALTAWQAVRATSAQRDAVAARQAETDQRVAAEIAEGEARSQRDLAREHLLDSLLRELRSITTVRPLGFRQQLQDRVRQALELSPSAQRREALRSEFTRGLGDPLGLSPVKIVWDPPLGEQDQVHLRLSPDGRLAATWSTARGLIIRETGEASTVARLELPGASLISMAFSPDSRRLFGVITPAVRTRARIVTSRDGGVAAGK